MESYSNTYKFPSITTSRTNISTNIRSSISNSMEKCKDMDSLWSFLGGALSASLVWGIYLFSQYQRQQRKQIKKQQEKQEEEKEQQQHRFDFEYIKHRIGELPRKPIIPVRWPWDRIRRPSSRSSNSTTTPAATGINTNMNSDGNVALNSGSMKSTLSSHDNKNSHHWENGDELFKNKSGVCIGSIFGLDVGGTLAKLVYFDINAPLNTSGPRKYQIVHPGKHQTHIRTEDDLIPKDKLSSSTVSSSSKSSLFKKRNFSMFDLTTKDHAKALESFYTFANRLDTYGETGIKETHLSFYSHTLQGEFHFIQFETRNMSNAMNLIRSNNLHVNISEMGATGGGAHKYADMWENILDIGMKKVDELESLVAGMQFILADGNVVGESYTFKPQKHVASSSTSKPNSKSQTKCTQEESELQSKLSKNEVSNSQTESCTKESLNATSPVLAQDIHAQSNHEEKKEAIPPIHETESRSVPTTPSAPTAIPSSSTPNEENWSQKVQLDYPLDSSSYPYLVVIIGTGVSILRVDGPRQHERISGSTIGGGTYLGLCRLLTDKEDYVDVMNLAEQGDPSKVDMTVGDIYGQKDLQALEKLGLPASLVASSFGKLVTKQDPASGLKQEDLARALLIMVTNNIGQVAYLNAKLHHTSRLYFVGNFLRHNNISQRRLAYAIDYWSKGKMEALFLEHEGYFGALGAFLLSQGIPTQMEQQQQQQKQQQRGGNSSETEPMLQEDEKPEKSPSLRDLSSSISHSFRNSLKLSKLS